MCREHLHVNALGIDEGKTVGVSKVAASNGGLASPIFDDVRTYRNNGLSLTFGLLAHPTLMHTQDGSRARERVGRR